MSKSELAGGQQTIKNHKSKIENWMAVREGFEPPERQNTIEAACLPRKRTSKTFIVRADERLTAFVELELAFEAEFLR
jgi:predicted HicB family RNase H-like nuclease